MPYNHIQREYFWIPRLYGQDPERGTYAWLPPGGWQFVSDQDPATIPWNPAIGLQQRALHLPSWFPRKCFLIGAKMGWGSGNPSAGINELTAYVDPGGEFFLSGNPHGAEEGSNFTKTISLFQEAIVGGQQVRRGYVIDPPILLDRDAGDLIEVKGGFNQAMDWIYVGFRFSEDIP